jgi:iron complex outermembrane receptor protein
MHFSARAMSIVLFLNGSSIAYAQSELEAPPDGVEVLMVFGAGDPMSVLPNDPTDSVFGLSRTPLETPRSLSVLSGAMLETHGVQSISDIARIAPSTYTTFNFGIQGGVDIRNVSADSYFRGMKRVENRSALPTPVGATDRVEIVRGPPSPIFGSGKIGGYMNYLPKTARFDSGAYVEEQIGGFSLTAGTHEKRMLTAEFGGPVDFGDRPGGYYIYSQFEDSGLYYDGAFNRQEVVQATLNVDLSETVRLEAGTMLQNWKGVGVVGWNRVTQDLIDNGTYVSGSPLVNPDTDGSGSIELDEIQAAGGFSIMVPFAALGDRSALPDLPAQFALDPATIREVSIERDQAILERFVESEAQILFTDLIFTPGDSLTVTNKIYLEALNQEKAQDLSFARYQDQLTFEDKVIISHALKPLGWATIENAYSANVRHSDNELKTNASNQIYSRVDLTQGFTPSTTIANSLEDPVQYPWPAGNVNGSIYTEVGFGALSLIDFEHVPVSLVLGARYDYIDAETATLAAAAEGDDEGLSYSVSFTLDALEYVRPYVTRSEQTVLVMGNGGTLSVAGVTNGAYDSASLFEYGLKASLLDGRLAFAVAHFDQTRTTFDSDTGEVSATRGIGEELEIQYAPANWFSIVIGGTWQTTEYDPLVARNYTISPQLAGYLPQEALGGTIQTRLPAIDSYIQRAGTPDRIVSVSPTFRFGDGWGFSGSLVAQGAFFADVMRTIELPEATVVNLSLSFNRDTFSGRLSAYNVTDERYFRANQVDSAGGVMALPNPGRMADLRFAFRF